MLNILFSARPHNWAEYEGPLSDALAAEGLVFHLAREIPPSEVDYIVFAPNGPVTDFTPYTRTRAVMSLWAGVETVVTNATLTQPLTRMVDQGLTQGMIEWVVGHTLRLHLGMDRHVQGQDGIWRDDWVPPLAADRSVTVLGLGTLGTACGLALSQLGFPVTGWSRNAKNVPGLRCLHGDDGLSQALAGTEILILLLPETPQTTGIINATTLAQMPKGAMIINPGRGPLIDDAALIDALNNDQISQATLDVFSTEPLPAAHPYWGHPRVTVTPHIASTTRPKTAAQTIAANIAGHEKGQQLQNLVDRSAGY
jgi:glyoxylate/hydroxypyruvate reductase A